MDPAPNDPPPPTPPPRQQSTFLYVLSMVAIGYAFLQLGRAIERTQHRKESLSHAEFIRTLEAIEFILDLKRNQATTDAP